MLRSRRASCPFFCGAQHRYGALHVDAERLKRLLDRKLHARKRRLVKNIFRADNDGRKLVVIANIDLVIGRLRIDTIFAFPRRIIVNDVNVMAERYQFVDDVGAHESSPSRHHDFLFFHKNVCCHAPRAERTIRTVCSITNKSSRNERCLR